ncbi:hypothetical protein V6N11_022260 [Hibiscus sabdariffa]|uniref:Uncharacterized protein n=1 Tax=Hibiscus sabdariffa TaxID=183260 RepID=A0ABR2TIM9_9ROSI
MTRSNPTELVEFNPEIEASARRAHGQVLREKKKQRERSNSERTANSTNEESTDSTNHPNDPTPPIAVPCAPMADQTIRQFFPTVKASEIRRSILGIKQKYEESLHEYWE